MTIAESSSNPLKITVRPGVPSDAAAIAELNSLLAETERKRLDPATIRAGVETLLTRPEHGRYFVAVEAGDAVEDSDTVESNVAARGGRVVGQLMHTREWSDWRNGEIWWLQSVFVVPEARRQGVFRLLLDHLRTVAAATPGVIGLRLYVEHANAAAQTTYERLGFQPAGYHVLEFFPAEQRRDGA